MRSAAPRDGSDQNDAVRLHTIAHGPAPVRFLLVHGLASNARLWDGVGGALAARGIGSVAVDLRGHGHSPKPDDGYDHDTITGDLVPLLEDRPVVVGQSWGGCLAVELAVRHPDLVPAVVCVDGGAIDLKARFPEWERCREALAPPSFNGTTLEQVTAWMRQNHADWPDAGIAGTLANFEILENGTVRPWLTRDRHLRILRALWEYEPSQLWPKVSCPVLFLSASELQRAAVEEAQRALPGARVEWFEGADHDLHAQHPERVAALLAELA